MQSLRNSIKTLSILSLMLAIGLVIFLTKCSSKSGGGSSGTPPPAPTGVAAIAGNDQVTLDWIGAAGAASYNIYWSTSGFSGTKGTRIANVKSPYNQPGLTNGATYYYVVTAVNSYGESPASNQTSTTLTSIPPKPPADLKAAAGDQQVLLTWDASPDAASYDVSTSTTSGGPYSAVGVITTTSYTVTGLVNGTGYYYIVTAVNGYGSSAPSNEVHAIPGKYNTYHVGKNPVGIAIDGTGNIWVTNQVGNTVTELNSSGVTVGTYAAGASSGAGPQGIAIDKSGNVWVVNMGSFTVTKLNSSGVTIETYAAGAWSRGIAIDASGSVWIENQGDDTVTNLSSNGGLIFTYAVGTTPYGMAIDNSGNVWVAHFGGNIVTELNSNGITIGTYSVGSGPDGIAIDSSGNVWVENFNSNNVTELNSSGSIITTVSAGTNPQGIAIDGSGNVWVVNNGDNTVAELNPTGGLVNTYSTGSGPDGIAIDGSGNVWVANNYDNTVTELMGITKGPQYFPYTGPIWP